ncbi:hypothetical protein ACA910_018528 [Epithemia clementina (nom. ined.)]
MSNLRKQNYREALALNNMAVTLMQNGCFEQASSTLSDSLALMQTAFVPQEQIKKRRTGPSFEKSSARCSESLSNSPSLSPSSSNAAEIQPLNDEQISELRAAVNCGGAPSKVFPIRISEFSCWNDNKSETPEITMQLGIILYNQAVANFLLSIQSGNRNNKYLRRCQKLLKMAEAPIFTTLNGDVSAKRNSAVLLILALSLNIQIAIFQSHNLTGKVQEAQKAVASLCASVDEQHTLAKSCNDVVRNQRSAIAA